MKLRDIKNIVLKTEPGSAMQNFKKIKVILFPGTADLT